MNYPIRRLDPADASVLTSVRGIPSWAAILIAAIFGGVGIFLARVDDRYTIGWIFGALFLAGIVLTTLAVKRRSIFTAMVQAPILITLLVFGTFRFLAGSGNLVAATNIVSAFPTMAIATGAALLLGLVRIIAQPIRQRPHPVDQYV